MPDKVVEFRGAFVDTVCQFKNRRTLEKLHIPFVGIQESEKGRKLGKEDFLFVGKIFFAGKIL
jgi:hypothetical protein